MGKETFLLLFVLGASALAIWIAARLPRLAPTTFTSGGMHLAAAALVGSALGPALEAVPGLPSRTSLLVALFVVALPAITYMLLVGLWLVQLTIRRAPAARL
jgi:hypothetical protein